MTTPSATSHPSVLAHFIRAIRVRCTRLARFEAWAAMAAAIAGVLMLAGGGALALLIASPLGDGFRATGCTVIDCAWQVVQGLPHP